LAERVEIYEVGPRDGLQNEAHFVPTRQKIELINLLSACGFRRVEVASFVNPKRVPQMADGREVMEGILRRSGVAYAALTPNEKGYDAALGARADEVAIFASASEGFSQANINCSISESLERFGLICERAKRDRMPVRGYVSCVTDCPYDGPTPPRQTAWVAEALAKLGCHEISLGDTIGHGTPETVRAMLDAVLAVLPSGRLAGHFHDTRGHALENIDTCLERGLRVFDSSVAGLGGCPFAPGSKGNVATGRVVDHLDAQGFAAGIDRGKLAEAEHFAAGLRHHSMEGAQ
jgi:hydroxymethylglutaryl-CoA lyase